MAAPIMFCGMTGVLGPPAGSEDEVVALPVRRVDGTIVSCWKLTVDELQEVARTGVVWLSVWGHSTQPPVMVAAFKDHVI